MTSDDAVVEAVVQFGAEVDRIGRARGGVDRGDEVDGTSLGTLHFSDSSKGGLKVQKWHVAKRFASNCAKLCISLEFLTGNHFCKYCASHCI